MNDSTNQSTDFDTKWGKLFPWTFHKLPLAAVAEGADGKPVYQGLNNSCGVFRSDGAELKTVGSDFEIVQPDEIKEVFRPFIDSGKVTLTRGHSFKGGSAIIAYGDLSNAVSEIVPHDLVKGEIVMYSGFDGTMPIGGSVSIRQARCTNQLAIALRAEMDSLLNRVLGKQRKIQLGSFRLKHTKNVRMRMETASSILAGAYQAFQESTEIYKTIAGKRATDQQLRTYVRRVFEIVDGPLAPKEERSAIFETKVRRVIELLDTQRNLETVPASRGTMWQGYGAITEYLTHEAGRNDDTRLNGILFGDTANQSRTALALALQH